MTLQKTLDSIPYVAAHAMEVLASPGEDRQGAISIRMRMPFRPEVQNYIGSMHAGALYTAAESVAGSAAYGLYPDGRAHALLRQSEVRYTRRAMGDVVAEAVIGSTDAAAAKAAFAETGKGDVAVAVTLTDPEDETVFEGTFEYALRRAKP